MKVRGISYFRCIEVAVCVQHKREKCVTRVERGIRVVIEAACIGDATYEKDKDLRGDSV